MSTTTKPRPRRGTPAPTEEQLATRAIAAEKIGAAARRKAERMAKDPEANRSTRARAALKVKASALDEVLEVLAGRG